MNSRKPIFALLAVGIAVVIALTFVPYAFLERAGRAVTAILPGAREATVDAPARPLLPAFNVEGWYAERGEDPARHGVHIESIDGKSVLASHNPDLPFNPASLLKLATSLAVLRAFGPDHRFETRVYTDGVVGPDKTLKGNLVLAGNDPMFGDVAASLVARELRARGVEKVSGELLVTPGFSFNYAEKADDSAERVAKVMEMKEKATGVGETPAGEPRFVVKSYPLREILLYMNAHSNNFVAERLGALVGGPEGLKRFLVEELKLPAEQVEVERTSGRENNRMTARGIVSVVRALKAEAERHGMRVEDLMPVASDDAGTLRRRLEGTPLEGATIGKTGTLTAEVDGGMASLAGVVFTETAGMVAFAILDQGSRIAENRELEDILLAQVIASQDIPRLIHSEEVRRRLLPATSLRVEPEALAGLVDERDDKKQTDERESDEEEASTSKSNAKTRDGKRVEEKASQRSRKPEPSRADSRKREVQRGGRASVRGRGRR
ncbi:MAG TPA: D-alanyl-D-alanine carboxypeptidase [Pyrinomonadaceae bacterium]